MMSKRSKQLAANVRHRIDHHEPKKLWFKPTPGKASDVLSPDDFDSYLKKHPDIRIILYGRDSTRQQYHKHNLDVLKKVLRGAVRKRGKSVIASFWAITSGWAIVDNRAKLLAAIKLAKQQNKPTIVLTTAANRYLRHEYYKSTNPLLPTTTEWNILKGWAGDIPLVTLLPPDMSESKVLSQCIKWGMKIKNRKGGRKKKAQAGYKKQIRIEKLPQVLKLYYHGSSLYAISKQVDVAWSTIKDWIVKYAKR